MSQLFSIHHDFFCNTLHSKSMCSIVRVWPQCWQVFSGPCDKIWDFVALVWLIRSRVITNSSALVRGWKLFGGPSVGFKRHISLPCFDTSHLIWPYIKEVSSSFKSAWWAVVSGSKPWPRISFASWSIISLPSMLHCQWLGTQQKWTHVPVSPNS